MKHLAILGIDEAGRGPVLGPMVIACVGIPEGMLPALQALGVRDSKALTAHRREQLEAAILALGLPHRRLVIDAPELDAGNLNSIGLHAILTMVQQLPCDELQLDAPVTPRGLEAYRAKVRASLDHQNSTVRTVRAENKAEDRYPAVAAASILAKTERDRVFRVQAAPWEAKFGPAGSGYPSDPTTRRFVAACLRADVLPTLVRRRWATVERIRNETAQGSLFAPDPDELPVKAR